jgi:hypothetical protein
MQSFFPTRLNIHRRNFLGFIDACIFVTNRQGPYEPPPDPLPDGFVFVIHHFIPSLDTKNSLSNEQIMF